jgi:pSer/pThr/pTyr-binding forkhead associated (FHA) protein
LVTITDLDSTNGTILNGLSIAPDFPNPLVDGQTNVIEVGGLEIRIDR